MHEGFGGCHTATCCCCWSISCCQSRLAYPLHEEALYGLKLDWRGGCPCQAMCAGAQHCTHCSLHTHVHIRGTCPVGCCYWLTSAPQLQYYCTASAAVLLQ